MAHRNALEIARGAAAIIGISDLPGLVGLQDPEARAMLTLLNRAGTILSRARNAWGASWADLVKGHVLTTDEQESGEVERIGGGYDLPADYATMVNETAWDITNHRPIDGNTGPQDWSSSIAWLSQVSDLRQSYRIVSNMPSGLGRRLQLYPVPPAGREVVFFYNSTHWVRGADGTTRDHILENTDVPILDDTLMELDLVWRFKHSRGLHYQLELAEFDQERNRLMAQDSEPRTIQIGRRRIDGVQLNIPEGNWNQP